jgi:hypothetical protein
MLPLTSAIEAMLGKLASLQEQRSDEMDEELDGQAELKFKFTQDIKKKW